VDGWMGRWVDGWERGDGWMSGWEDGGKRIDR
jgi:hypothetical protein